MKKVSQILLVLMLIIGFGGAIDLSRSYGSQINFPCHEEITWSKPCHIPFSIPQNSNSQNQPLEEDLLDDDDQDKIFNRYSYLDSILQSLTLPHFFLTFTKLHHEVVTPPPQS